MKRCQEKLENAYLTVKNARASGGPKAGPGPWPIWACFAGTLLLHALANYLCDKYSWPPSARAGFATDP